jgi:hypothetical protein
LTINFHRHNALLLLSVLSESLDTRTKLKAEDISVTTGRNSS